MKRPLDFSPLDQTHHHLLGKLSINSQMNLFTWFVFISELLQMSNDQGDKCSWTEENEY